MIADGSGAAVLPCGCRLRSSLEGDPMAPATSTRFAVWLFGPFQVHRHGAPLEGLRSRKGHQLLALLVLRHGAEVERSWLAGTLWPESDEPKALASLRNSLKVLRRDWRRRLASVGSWQGRNNS
jgi:hypothetical protein